MNKTPLTYILFALLIFSGCGKRQPPLPPVERVSQRVTISGSQRGSQVDIYWTMPPRNASEGNVLNINRADIFRLAEPINSSLSLTEDEFASRSTLISSVPIQNSDFALKQLKFTDRLEFAGQPARLRYAIRFVNEYGQKAAFSNFLLIEPTAKVASAPTQIKAQASQEAILLNWNAPSANVDGTTPANILGYNVYRSSPSEDAIKLLNKTPLTKTEFADEFFEFKTSYSYFVRAISLGTNGSPVESADSAVTEILPIDVFPPTPPTAITIAASPTNLSLFFAVNPEKDIAGYRLYRSEDPNLPKTQWTVLNAELLTTNTFQDAKIQSSKTYYYYLKAFDNAGNASEPSEVVSETAP